MSMDGHILSRRYQASLYRVSSYRLLHRVSVSYTALMAAQCLSRCWIHNILYSKINLLSPRYEINHFLLFLAIGRRTSFANPQPSVSSSKCVHMSLYWQQIYRQPEGLFSGFIKFGSDWWSNIEEIFPWWSCCGHSVHGDSQTDKVFGLLSSNKADSHSTSSVNGADLSHF